ncbi:PLP-dependent cysteine synthase family protein [Alkalimarinus sediminis]|uniref:L-cysteine desulfhydrase Cds1 n=2 Tax=Alkalimarinus sediminis TaxID=1632866 RepID=A0A9E8KQT9_9ALTE|nr:PLP-dependent cysteine synthase family protein [Alkalimarinus sediminis]UZW76778.1 PLP-dependent cysteine synthase family protein [Alkalimarinus sediminis]
MNMNHWVHQAIQKINADFKRSADTHLIKLELPACDDIDLYLKDESTHPTGSLKHRLARSLFLYGLCNGWIKQGTTVIESSSGSTAVSEAYFARLLGLPFIAVIPKGTSKEKIGQIEFYGGTCHLVDPPLIYDESRRLAAELNGHYMDQFTYAERATDWRGNNNIAESIYSQMALERFNTPLWVIMSAGTGGTSATIGRYIRYECKPTQLCLADCERSVFYDYYMTGDCSIKLGQSSRIEGIGRPRVEPSFIPSLIDDAVSVSDSDSIATMRFAEALLNKKCGGSTGTNLYVAFQKISEMREKGQKGSVVTLICDSGERYLDTYYNDQWLIEQGLDISSCTESLQSFYETGVLKP